MVNYLPIIKVLDTTVFVLPQRVTVITRDDGKLWWKYINAIPTVQHDFSKIKISANGIQDRYEYYKFSQCLFTILLYNNLQLDKAQKFTIVNDNDTVTFTYFLDEDEIISIPIMPNHPHSLKFTLFEKYPVLKLRTNPK